MSLSRRTFLSGLSTVFGAASMPDLRKRILDVGRPILLEPKLVAKKIFVYEGGHLGLGDHWIDNVARQSR